MNGRAYGLDTIREGWRHLANCTPAVADLFTDWHTRDTAKMICVGCPVLQRCYEEFEALPREMRKNATAGGVWWTKHGLPEGTPRPPRVPQPHRGRSYGAKLCRFCRKAFSKLSPNHQYCSSHCESAGRRARARNRHWTEQ